MTPPTVTLVVARARNGVIGAGGHLPWRQKTDMAHFKRVTLGKPVVMGRKTWASLKGPLKDRDNIVLSRDPDLQAPGAWLFTALDAALACAESRARSRGVHETCVIGGADLYRQALPLARRILVTDIDADIAGDAHFPEPDTSAWREVAAQDAPAGAGDDHAMRFRVLERV